MAGRFSFQMPESRHNGHPWFRIGQLDVTTTVFVTLLGAASMVMWAISPQVVLRLALLPNRVLSGEVWRLITWPLANRPDLWTIIGLAIFWYFGREIESLMGRNRFAWFLVMITLIPAVVATLLNLPQAGFRPVQFSVFLVFIAQHPFARFFFGIPAWALGAVFVGLEVLQLVGLRQGRGVIFLFVTLATAAIAARSYGLMQSLPWIPALGLPGSESAGSRRRDRPKRSKKSPKPARSSRTVVDGPWSEPSQPSGDAGVLQAELDSLLDKISAGGMDALSTDEKRRLNELSKRLR
jgi:hypothetical protein